MNIQHHYQHWLGHDRLMLVAIDDNGQFVGSTQVDYGPKLRCGAECYIYAMWVHPDHRRQGVATALLKAAEEYTLSTDRKSIALEWHIDEAPFWVFDFYVRQGYDERESTPGKSALMVKQLA